MGQVVLAFAFEPGERVITYRLQVGTPCVIPLPVPLTSPDGGAFTSISVVVEDLPEPDLSHS